MPATPIVTDVGSVFYDVGNATVEVADTLGGSFAALGSGTLRVDSLTLEIAPGVDQASLTFIYGVQMEEGDTSFAAIAPADLNGKFVKITLPDTVGSDDLVWYGVIDADDRNVMGSQATEEPTGMQQFTAYGLLRLFERTRITTANIYVDADNVLEIGRGLAFNRDQEGRFTERGNRSTLDYEGGTGSAVCFVFSERPRGETSWTAWQAVQYLLHFHGPTDSAGDPLATYALAGDEASLSWFQLAVDTDGKTVKEVLDALIDRRRGVSYRVDFDEGTTTLTITVFTFAEADITLPSGAVLKANPNLRSLDFEAAFDIEQCLVSNLAITKYDKVIARGQFKTSTCTLKFTEADNANPKLIPAWDDDEEDAYRHAANNEAGYADLDREEQERLNAATRASDELSHVFSRFTLSPSFLKKVAAESQEWWVAPLYDANGDPLKSEGTGTGESEEGEPLWLRGVRFERFLPLRDRRDYSGTQIEDFTFGDGFFDYGEPEYLRPFVFTNIEGNADGDDPHWVTLDRLAAALPDDQRQWAATLRLLDAGPQLQIEVHGAPQHFIAKTDDMTPLETESESTGDVVGVYADRDDPTVSGIPWTHFYATLCLRLDSRVEAEAEISTPAAGYEQRILTIDVPDARLDYVVPWTVVRLSKGKVVNSSSGGFVRDDREWLEDIARAAAEWYGRERQTLRLKWKQCRKLVEPGWLITDIGANYNRTGVNTVISKVTYTLTENAVSTEIETAFASLDVA